MRKTFSDIVHQLAIKDDRVVFITGDLGFNALENIRDSIKDRFINAGVAEQNMVGMAAGLAYKGFKVFCYSIAPFTTYRCLEQIRIDVCFHKLPVFIVGNGGGYGYGIMGATHHAIEDLACMSSLPNMTCYVPAFLEDVGTSLSEIIEKGSPAYLRLGLGKKNPFEETKNSDAMKAILNSENAKVTIVSMGPIINNVIGAIDNTTYKNQIDLFSVRKIPFNDLSIELVNSLKKTKKLLIVEEHIARGGLSEHISLKLMQSPVPLSKFQALVALGYPDGLYGDQNYHLAQSGLDSNSIAQIIKGWIEN